MAVVFLSYKREDVEAAKPVVEALESLGVSVWWDPAMVAGDPFSAVIQAEMRQATCCVVLWSERSVGSEWVNFEAKQGLDQDKLVPVKIDAVEPPAGFEHLHASSLVDWSGQVDHPEFLKIREAIKRHVLRKRQSEPPESRDVLLDAKRIVVKVGTSIVSRENGRYLAIRHLAALAESIAWLRQNDRQVILVSSGAIGLGLDRMGFENRPTDSNALRACAAAGQGRLIAMYELLFEKLGLNVAQVLVTKPDFDDNERFSNLEGTINRLLIQSKPTKLVPILNENDTVATDDTDAVLGDNDKLARLVASRLGGDALVMLSEVDGVHTKPPGTEGAEFIPTWREQTIQIGPRNKLGTGGIKAKIHAAKAAARLGVPAVIACGERGDTLERIFGGEVEGTFFPATTPLLL